MHVIAAKQLCSGLWIAVAAGRCLWQCIDISVECSCVCIAGSFFSAQHGILQSNATPNACEQVNSKITDAVSLRAIILLEYVRSFRQATGVHFQTALSPIRVKFDPLLAALVNVITPRLQLAGGSSGFFALVSPLSGNHLSGHCALFRLWLRSCWHRHRTGKAEYQESPYSFAPSFSPLSYSTVGDWAEFPWPNHITKLTSG